METLFAVLTPPGKAAIATLGVRGAQAWQITRQLFQPVRGVLPEQPIAGRFWYGRLGDDAADEVIVAVKEVDPCPALEIHCHGGIAVVQMIEELYVERGAAVVSWERFSSSDLLPLLARAPTLRTAAVLLDQAHGAWQAMIGQAVDPRQLGRLAELIPLGQHLVEPWKVALGGAPNVGKSSLMNALAGYTRSVVAPQPGTTRDVVTTRLAIAGWPVEMIDTAGLRQASAALEQQGIERARTALREADLCLWVLDGSAEPIFPDEPISGIFLINKVDLAAGWDWQTVPDALRISALSQAGVPELCDRIAHYLVPAPPAPGEAVPCLPDQREWVRRKLAAREARDVLAREGV
jgi:tRNA modification GTPase